MNTFVILALLVPTILAKPSGSTYEDKNINHMHHINELNSLTKILEESGGDYQNQSSIEVSEDDVSFYVHTRQNPDGQEVLFQDGSTIATVSSFQTDLKTVFLIHGWNNINSSFNSKLGPAFLEVEDVNVVIVNWDDLANGHYLTAYDAVPSVGVYVGQFIKAISETYGYSLDNIALVGHSLGAHICGYAGQETNGDLNRITGLDPAGLLYFESKPEERLSEDDAQYVIAIHTNAGFLGVSYRVANEDFWPNGGSSQPGCFLDLTGTCSHGRSHDYFLESLTSNGFVAKECGSYDDYSAGQCVQNSPVTMGGVVIDTTVTGSYYLNTNSESPYALGDVGISKKIK